jgi:hypothetical protein
VPTRSSINEDGAEQVTPLANVDAPSRDIPFSNIELSNAALPMAIIKVSEHARLFNKNAELENAQFAASIATST